MKQKNKKAIVAMSGGVDSSVAAAILKKKGYDVIGLFLNMHQNFNPKDTQKVAKKLNIPLKILNVRKEFKKRVVNYFIKEYRTGRTPNPCVECNKWIKFKFLMEKALALKADFIATGHYARLRREFPIKLLMAKDGHKDQSYFLWTLTQKQLKKTLFPIGDYTKEEVRAMAKKWDLPGRESKESQEICFVTNIYEFLKSRIHTNRGSIITTRGEKIGEHEGLAYYTIGQRKGIKIGGIGPFYVVNKDFKNNALIVAKSEHASELYRKEMFVEKVNWICGRKPKFPLRCKVKIRYLHPANPATVKQIANCNLPAGPLRSEASPLRLSEASKAGLQIVFDKKQRAITPGQSAVFYLRNEVLGGGIIT